MTDTVLAVPGVSILATFLGLIAWKVPQTPLLVVFVAVLGMAIFDFWLELRNRRQRRGR